MTDQASKTALYHYLSNESWSSVEADANQPGVIDPKELNAIKTLHKIAQDLNESEFVAAETQLDAIAVKLSPQEMESLKGGHWLWDAAVRILDDKLKKKLDEYNITIPGYND